MRPVFQPSPEDLPYLRRLAWTVLVAAVLLVVWRASDLLLLAFGSVLGAVIFRTAARQLQRIGIRNEKLALGLGVLLVLALLGVVVWLLVVQFGTEIAQILGNVPETLESIERSLSASPVGRAVVDAAQAAAGGSTIANRLGLVMLGGGQVLLNALIVLVGAMFIAADPRPYRRAVVLLTPSGGRKAVEHAIGEIVTALRLWLKAKILAMAVMTVLIGIALWAAGLESWAALALLGGLSEFVPYVGPTLAMIPALGLAAVAGEDMLWRTFVAYAVVRVIEAYLLTPWLNRQVIRIPPALTLFVILGVGAVFGIYGVFFAGALLVVAFVGVRELYLRDTLGESIDGVPRAKDDEGDDTDQAE